jgi:uncharacterized membrane protein
MSDAYPQWGLTLTYWLHLLATVVWIGGLVALSVLVMPAARKSLSAEDYARLLGAIQPRLQQMGWFSLMVLIFTGLFQMVAHPNYLGFLAVRNTWAVAMLTKHLAVGLMIILSAYVTWWLTPALQRLALLQANGREIDPKQAEKLHQREEWMMQVNLLLAVVILLLTALARSS